MQKKIYNFHLLCACLLGKRLPLHPHFVTSNCRKQTIIMDKKHFALKKLLEAVEKELLHKPNKKTLDRLSMLAGFQNWDTFQEALHGEADAKTNYKE